MGDNENLSLSTDIFWITTRLSIWIRLQSTILLETRYPPCWQCVKLRLTHATFIHSYFISSFVLTSIILCIISFIIFSVHHQLSVWQVAVSLQYLAAEMERTFQEEVNRENARPLAKHTKKKKKESRTL